MVEPQVLAARLARDLLGVCPSGWRGAQLVHRQVGGRTEQEASALGPTGPVALEVPAGAGALFAELRDAGPLWFTARVRLAPPDRFALDTDDDEPTLRGGVGWDEVCADRAVLAAVAPLPAWVARAQGVRRVAGQLHTTLLATGFAPGAVLLTDEPGRGWRVARSGTGWCVRRDGTPVGGVLAEVADAVALALGRLLLDVVRAPGPIAPLPADPPLSLLRGLRRVVLPAGTEVDRLGGSDGALVWVARTPWPRRSRPPGHADQPCAAYVLRRGVEALAGEAVPWFDQPGGGTAFVLPASLARLVADGALEQLG